MSRTPPTPRAPWLTRGVGAIGVASFLDDLGHEVPTALLPRFVTSTLGGSAALLGVIEGIADGLGGLARLAGGALADDPEQRRVTAVGGFASTAVLSSAIGAATSLWQVGALRAGGWIARGLRAPARSALLADAVPADAYGRAYGFERAMDNAGAIGGPLLALALIAAFSVRTAILLSVIPGLLAAGAALYAIRHIPRVTAKAERARIKLSIRPVFASGMGGLIAAIGMFELGNVAVTLLILRATQLLTPGHGLTAATELAVLLYLSYNVAATATSIGAGHLSDRSGAATVFGVGIVAFLVSYALFAVPGSNLGVLAAAFVLGGIGIGCAETAQSAAVALAAPIEIRGSAFGLVAGVQSFGNLIASSVGGLLWTLGTPVAAFIFLSICMLVSLVLLALSERRNRTRPAAVGI